MARNKPNDCVTFDGIITGISLQLVNVSLMTLNRDLFFREQYSSFTHDRPT